MMLIRKYICVALPLLLISGQILTNAATQPAAKTPDKINGTLEKLIAANANVTMDVDLARLGGSASGKENAKLETLRFSAASDSFFTILVHDNNLRGPLPGSLDLVAQGPANLPAGMSASAKQLIFERTPFENEHEFVVRDGKTGFVFFNVSGYSYDYDTSKNVFTVSDGRLFVSEEYAKSLGRPSLAGSIAGKISVIATMYPIEIDKVVDGAVQSAVMKPLRPENGGRQPDVGTTPGPDVIVGDISGVEEPTGGASGGFVGVGVGTTSCNPGVVDLDWFALPSNDHPVIPQNAYRMSGGATNSDKFEQIGQSWLKHAFTALTQNLCTLGCNNVGGTHLGSGCSDPYVASLNYDQTRLGSRAWVNPFTGVYPRGDSATNPNNHSGHTHTGTSHRTLIAISDLDPAQNPGATYYFEGQYVTPHEYVWCSGHTGECNMYNNISYRRFNPTYVSGNNPQFTFAASGATVRTSPALLAWTGSTANVFQPDPGPGPGTGGDGIGYVAYKVTNPSAGVWHYEYAVYNQNLDRAIQSFSVPLGCGITTSNLGFHAPPQHPAWANDGTLNSAGYSSTAWASNQTLTALTWNCETFAQNQNANAIRWGTLYNFRFDSNKAPAAAKATVGFFKTGSPITVDVQGPTADPCSPLQLTSVVSRETQGGAGTFDVDVMTGVECRSGGANGDHTLVFTFTNNVASGNAAVTAGAGSVTGVQFATNTMTVNLTGVTDAEQITVNLTNVQDSFAQTLPDTGVNVKVLVGDTNGDSSVNSADISQTKAQSGAPVNGSNMREDVNGDGTINSGDISLVKSKSGSSL